MSRCCWISDGEQCEFPGTMSDTVTGGDRWYCAMHRHCPDQFTGREIVDRSKRWVTLPNKAEAWVAARRAEVYRTGDNPAVAAIRAKLKAGDPATKAPLSKWLPYRSRDPGQDDEEAAA